MDRKTRRLLLSGSNLEQAKEQEREALEKILDGRYEEVGLERPADSKPRPARKTPTHKTPTLKTPPFDLDDLPPDLRSIGQVEKVWEEISEEDARRKAISLERVIGIALLALAVRLIFTFVISDPQVLIPSWSNDTWHRWQIAYLTKEIGLHRGFLRLWDLKGMEYYWGIVHPLLSVALFSITGSIDVIILRGLTLLTAVVNVVFLYLLGCRFWNRHVGLAAALLGALNPIVIFNDVSGMVEPISFALLLAAIYFFPRKAAAAGILLALASMVRAEAWVLSMGLLVAALMSKEPAHRKMSLIISWGIPILFYMKYLLDRTGNAIYPIYWNFLANAAGRWEYRAGFTDYQLAARPILAAVFLISTLAALWVFWKRPRGNLLLLLGFGVTAFISGFIGLTAYLKSYEPWFWLTRFFVFPYLFIGLLAAVALLCWLPERIGKPGWTLGWLSVGVLLMGSQLAWTPVMVDVEEGYTGQTSMKALEIQGEFVGEHYEGGIVLMPEGDPQLTYALARYGGIEGKHMLGQMYDPIYYYGGGDPFADWETVGPRMWDWLESENVALLIMYPGDRRFLTMIEESPESFEYLGTTPYGSYLIQKVHLQ